MKNTKILSIAVLLLLVTNIVLVVFMLTDKKKPGDRKGQGSRTAPPELMVKELNMTDQQQNDYKRLKEEHFKNVRPYFDSVKQAKTAFYDLVKSPVVSDSLINVLSSRVCEKQAQLDKITLTHFREVRNIFTAAQQPRFDSLVQKMMSQRGKRDSSAKKGK